MKGFIDLQVNGWMGLDFTQKGLSLEDVRRVTRDMVARGTVAYCPTIITGSQDDYRENFRVLASAMKDAELGPRLPGIHLEGPFISPEPGAVGAHPRKFVVEPDTAAFDRFQEWAGGGIRILTLAPERPGAEALIRHAVRQGVTVAIGHHMAARPDLARAVAAGATLCTHVGNGLPNLIHRHDNPLWWEMACDEVAGLFITDGHHLPADLIKVGLRAKTTERFIVTSDASPLAGMPEGDYTVFGGTEVTISKAGRISCEATGNLAGSHSTMIECMNHLASLNLLSERELWRVGLENQARVLGTSPDYWADLPGPDVRFENRRFVVG